MNNRTLLIVFASCLTLFLAGKLIRGNRSSSFDPVIVAVDTTRVDHLTFISGGADKKEFELKRNGTSWEAIQGTTKIEVPAASVQSILALLSELNAKRVVTKETSKYAEFEIGDEEAAKVTVWQGKKKVADLVVGGFRFDQATRSASSYIRKAGDAQVYLIDGFASLALKARFDQFRDTKLVKVEAVNLTSLQWLNNIGQKQVIQKEDGIWHYAGMEAVDSMAMEGYLSGLVTSEGSAFSELTSTQGLTMLEKLTLSGNNMTEPTILSAFANQDTVSPFLIHSSANPGALFNSDSSGLYKRIFTDLRQFWPNGQ